MRVKFIYDDGYEEVFPKAIAFDATSKYYLLRRYLFYGRHATESTSSFHDDGVNSIVRIEVSD